MQQKSHTPPPGLSLGLTDIYHILFRQKWKILAAWMAGFALTAAVWAFWPVAYESEAKLLVKYILEDKPYRPVFSNSTIQSPGIGVDGSIKAEVQILTSFDISLIVATNVGAEKILKKAGGGGDVFVAASLIQKGLSVAPPEKSAIMQVVFQHPDPEVVQPVLAQVIESYKKMHNEVHMASGATDEVLQKELVSLKSELGQTESSLRQVKSKAGISSLGDTRKVLTERFAKIQEDLFNAKAEQAERQAGAPDLSEAPVEKVRSSPAAQQASPMEKVRAYQRICGLLESFEAREKELSVLYTAQNPLVQEMVKKVAETEAAKVKMEKEFPLLAGTQVSSLPTAVQPVFSARDVALERNRLRAIQARITVLGGQLEEVQKETAAVDAVESTITDLERKRDILEQNLRERSANMERVSFNHTLASSGTENISVIESPTLPGLDREKLHKVLLGLLGGTIAFGLALAFGVELYLDQSIKRPVEIESKLGIPLFLSIPRAAARTKGGLAARPRLTNGSAPGGNGSNGHGPGASLSGNAELGEFFDTLRDRLVMNFEVRNLTHKPKLVAVTSCAPGSGVSTVASGLAASLSKTGEGNVLLVDMNHPEKGVAQYFHKGKLECNLEDALAGKRPESMLAPNNLFVVSDTPAGEQFPKILHRRFSSLMPKLRASDYDYIIFDMPPVSQVSPTPKLAQFMDMVFMVVEAERTGLDVVKRASHQLREAKATVGVIFNKHHNYLPRRMQQEL